MPDYLSPSRPMRPTTSGGFSGARPAEHNFGDYFADTAGSALAKIGIGALLPESEGATGARARHLMEADQRKQQAWGKIAEMAKTVDAENGNDVYFEALPLAAGAGIETDELVKFFRSAAGSRGAGDMVLGRMGDRGVIPADATFTPEVAHARGVAARGRTLADQSSDYVNKLTEATGKSIDTKRAASLTHQRALEMEGVQQANRVALAGVRADAPPSPLGPADSQKLREMVTTALAGRAGVLPTKEGDIPTGEGGVDMAGAEGLVDEVTAKAAALMVEGKLSAAEAIQAAADELAIAEPTAPDVAGTDLTLLGIPFGTWGGKKGGPKISRAQSDPLGLRAK